MIIGVVPEVCSGGGSYLYSIALLEAVSRVAEHNDNGEFICLLERMDERVRCSWRYRLEEIGNRTLMTRLKGSLKGIPWLRPAVNVYHAARGLKNCAPPDPDKVRPCEARRRILAYFDRSEERRVGKECRSR